MAVPDTGCASRCYTWPSTKLMSGDESNVLVEQFQTAFTEMDGHVYVSQARCVDMLIDIYSASRDDVVVARAI